jgi:hypothetical protein
MPKSFAFINYVYPNKTILRLVRKKLVEREKFILCALDKSPLTVMKISHIIKK